MACAWLCLWACRATTHSHSSTARNALFAPSRCAGPNYRAQVGAGKGARRWDRAAATPLSQLCPARHSATRPASLEFRFRALYVTWKGARVVSSGTARQAGNTVAAAHPCVAAAYLPGAPSHARSFAERSPPRGPASAFAARLAPVQHIANFRFGSRVGRYSFHAGPQLAVFGLP